MFWHKVSYSKRGDNLDLTSKVFLGWCFHRYTEQELQYSTMFPAGEDEHHAWLGGDGKSKLKTDWF